MAFKTEGGKWIGEIIRIHGVVHTVVGQIQVCYSMPCRRHVHVRVQSERKFCFPPISLQCLASIDQRRPNFSSPYFTCFFDNRRAKVWCHMSWRISSNIIATAWYSIITFAWILVIILILKTKWKLRMLVVGFHDLRLKHCAIMTNPFCEQMKHVLGALQKKYQYLLQIYLVTQVSIDGIFQHTPLPQERPCWLDNIMIYLYSNSICKRSCKATVSSRYSHIIFIRINGYHESIFSHNSCKYNQSRFFSYPTCRVVVGIVVRWIEIVLVLLPNKLHHVWICNCLVMSAWWPFSHIRRTIFLFRAKVPFSLLSSSMAF